MRYRQEIIGYLRVDLEDWLDHLLVNQIPLLEIRPFTPTYMLWMHPH